MAKSLRSKRKRKMRAIKRERYGKKELEMLKQTVEGINNTKDEEMKEIYKVRKGSEVIDEMKNQDTMDVDTDAKKYNKKTKLDEHGNYPVWMNSRQIKKQKKKNKVQKNKENTETKRY